MNLLNENRKEYMEREIKHYEEVIEGLKQIKPSPKLTQAGIDSQVRRNEYKIQARKDEILINEALMSINIRHCEEVGIDIAELTKAIKRNTTL